MTDWRPGAPSTDNEVRQESHHKQARIRRILDAYPDLTFVLIGDSGERDPQVYQEFLDSDPDRIRIALIRDVSADAGAQDDIDVTYVPGHPELVTVRDSIQMARIAHRMGLIDELTVEEVMAEIDARV